LSATDFVASLQDLLSWYPTQVDLVLQNLVDSHDTDRFASMMVNPDLEFDQANRIQDSNPDYNMRPPTEAEYARVRCALVLQFTFVGAPMIWYGDEVGMFGADDPHCRKPMVWADLEPYADPAERVHEEQLEHYQRLIAIRRSCAPLRLGDVRFVYANDDENTLAYLRTLDNEQVLVAINNSDRGRTVRIPWDLPDGTAVIDLLDPAAAAVRVPPVDASAGRPAIRVRADALPAGRISDKHVRVELGPYSGSVLVPRG
jgi:cyclomaltodextrinase